MDSPTDVSDSKKLSETSVKIIPPSSSFEANGDATHSSTDSLKDEQLGENNNKNSEHGVQEVKKTKSPKHVQVQRPHVKRPTSPFHRAEHLFDFAKRKKKKDFRRKSKRRSSYHLNVQLPDRGLESSEFEESDTTDDESKKVDEEGSGHHFVFTILFISIFCY